MKRLICLALALVMLCGTASFAFAADRHRDRRGGQEQRQFHKDDGPLKWGEHRRSFENHRMSRVHDRHLDRRYPGLHAYKWRGEGDNHRGFWHNGRYVKDGFMFFDNDDRMAGFGYVANGAFVFVNEDGYHEDRNDLIFLMILMKLLDSLD